MASGRAPKLRLKNFEGFYTLTDASVGIQVYETLSFYKWLSLVLSAKKLT
jgi:hypothetical protein